MALEASPTFHPRLIALGESMVMVTPALPESLATADDLRLHVGGAESNVACHAAALGVPSAWVSAVGSDVLGERIVRVIRDRGVDVGWVTSDPDAPTGVYFKDPGNGVLYYRSSSAASRMSPASVVDVPLEQADIVHISGITPALSRSCADLIDAVIDRVAAVDGVLSFDVNHRAALWEPGAAASALLVLADRADLVFVGLDEAEIIWECRTADDVRAVLPSPRRLVVKDGAVGATEFDRIDGRDVVTFVPAIATRVVEPVGAGDAFAAGYLAAMLNGADAATRLTAGHERAHLVLLSTSDFIVENGTTDDAREGDIHAGDIRADGIPPMTHEPSAH
ncbi:sugar kinase [Planctomonas sp. JC2975]|uniref:sugar kinase n=1 Tax=Planctomonas sp. JC2975 TaxID=2729626 RepID=UPI00147439FD|nr:sugar kinase [Planctomonas sp. JC2975]NNC11530.1 sugar kinase [Planctomonas sp. JC2975]